MTVEQRLLKQVELGLDTQQFLRTGVGKRILQRAAEQEMESLKAMIDVDVTDTARMRELQANARLGSMVLAWLNEMIVEGENAETALQQSETTD